MTDDNLDLAAKIRTISDYPKAGIQFRDITSLLVDGEAFRTAIDRLAARIDGQRVDLFAGIEARGFIIASALSYALGKGHVLLRKSGKLPGHAVGMDYALEYGSDRIEMHVDQVAVGHDVIIVDDLIATGGTALAATELLRGAGAIVRHALFLVDLPDLGGAERLREAGVEPVSLCRFDGD